MKKLFGKRVLVTGADGFIGSHLVETLLAHGATVRALCQYNSFNHWGWLESIPNLSEVEVICGDIRDAHTCDQITQNIDIIFHLAALISIPYSYLAPGMYLDTNIKGTTNICHAAMKNHCERIIHTSTSEVYGTALYVPIDEKHPLQPQSPYSASKIGADSLAMSYFYSFDLPLTIARPFNTYGPRQSARAIIPTIITQLANGLGEIKVGDLTPTRDFTYVIDTCEGFIALALSNSTLGETVNIGNNSEISVEHLCEMIAMLMKKPLRIHQDSIRKRPPKSEVRQLRCDNTKLVTLTGFAPKVSLEEGLLRSIDWFTQPQNLKEYKTELYAV